MTEEQNHPPPSVEEPAAKRVKVDDTTSAPTSERVKGITPIKPEYILAKATYVYTPADYDDEAEGNGMENRPGVDDSKSNSKMRKNRKEKRETRGQNKGRKMIQPKDTVKLCESVNSQFSDFFNKLADEGKFTYESPEETLDGIGSPALQCNYGERCKYEHSIPVYLKAKPEDIEGVCPVYEAIGYCPSGLKCRWLHSHYAVRAAKADDAVAADSEDGHLLVNPTLRKKHIDSKYDVELNRVPGPILNTLQRKKFQYELSDKYIKYLDARVDANKKANFAESKPTEEELAKESNFDHPDKEDQRAAYVEAPFLATEKRKLDLDRKYIVSPLTTVGNLPYRRLMKTLGADITYCEMALALPIVQGHKSEWALPRAHASEVGNFGVQITASKHWQAIKAAESIAKLSTPGAISEINLNCGCPIDMVYRSGAGAALMDNPSRLVRILEGMNAVSGDIPVAAKIRTGTRDDKSTAVSLVKRIVAESPAAAITIHGRSRAQRYTKVADWDYISEVAATAKKAGLERQDEEGEGRYRVPWVVGNGDVYSWEDWYAGIDKGVDSVMVARGALIKPWIFEEIEAKQHLDKSASERLEYIKRYCEFGLEHWGSDEYGVNLTRRYLCESLSFAHRYIPVGILEHLPPKINDRPPPWQGRNDMETLLGSSDYKDWIKISELFLGKTSDQFEFTPKHKSNSYSNNAVAAPRETPAPQAPIETAGN